MTDSAIRKERITRPLKPEELSLLQCLLQIAGITKNLNGLFVSDMDDGGMGSVRFVGNGKQEELRRMGKRVSEKQFLDIDQVPILVSLNVDEEGELLEIDIWKVDFNPVQKYPSG